MVAEGVVGGIKGPGGGCRASSMTMAESAVEDAAAAPPGPAKPPPPSCTNNNTLAATANRNHRNLRRRKRLDQVLDILQHRSSPSEGEVLRFEGSGPASEEEEDVFGSPRSSSRSAADPPSGISLLPLRLKSEEPATPTGEDQEDGSSANQSTTATTATTTITTTITTTTTTTFALGCRLRTRSKSGLALCKS